LKKGADAIVVMGKGVGHIRLRNCTGVRGKRKGRRVQMGDFARRPVNSFYQSEGKELL